MKNRKYQRNNNNNNSNIVKISTFSKLYQNHTTDAFQYVKFNGVISFSLRHLVVELLTLKVINNKNMKNRKY